MARRLSIALFAACMRVHNDSVLFRSTSVVSLSWGLSSLLETIPSFPQQRSTTSQIR